MQFDLIFLVNWNSILTKSNFTPKKIQILWIMNLQNHETCVLIPKMWLWGFQDIHKKSIRCSSHGKIQNKYKGSIVIHQYRESQAIVGKIHYIVQNNNKLFKVAMFILLFTNMVLTIFFFFLIQKANKKLRL
jgi:hypothetical protein